MCPFLCSLGQMSVSLISMNLSSPLCLSQTHPINLLFTCISACPWKKQKSQCQTEFELQYMSSNELEKSSQIQLDGIVPGIPNIKSKTNFSKTASDFIEVQKAPPIQKQSNATQNTCIAEDSQYTQGSEVLNYAKVMHYQNHNKVLITLKLLCSSNSRQQSCRDFG